MEIFFQIFKVYNLTKMIWSRKHHIISMRLNHMVKWSHMFKIKETNKVERKVTLDFGNKCKWRQIPHSHLPVPTQSSRSKADF